MKLAATGLWIWPLEPLIDHFHKAAFDEFVIGTAQNRECIILNNKEILNQDDLDELDAKPLKGTSKSIEYQVMMMTPELSQLGSFLGTTTNS